MAERVPAGLDQRVAASLGFACSLIGAREEPKRPNRGKVVDQFQPQYIRANPSALGVPWCASFVGMSWFAGFGAHPFGKLIMGADTLKDAARKAGQWRDLSQMPRPGDAFVLIHGIDTPGFNKGHTGLVLRVSEDGLTVQCVEGNARNGVRLIERKVPLKETSELIMGFASPLPLNAQATGWERGLLSEGVEKPGGSTR